MLHADESVCKILIRQRTTCCRQMNLCAQNKEAGEQEIDKKKAIVCAATGELLTKLQEGELTISEARLLGEWATQRKRESRARRGRGTIFGESWQ